MVPNLIIPGAKILLLSEAPGDMEKFLGRPFVGASGNYLNRLLEEAGIARTACSLANVFLDRPKDGKLESWAKPSGKGVTYNGLLVGPIGTGVYLDPEISLEALARLEREIKEARPNIIIALGNIALWALTGKTGISKARGAITQSTLLCPGTKVLPTYHPSAVSRDQESHTIVVADLIKAKTESDFPEIRRMKRTIWIAERPDDIPLFFKVHPHVEITVDVETSRRQITVVGFATSELAALVIPIYNKYSKTDPHVWSLSDEKRVWREIKKVCESPIPKILQNGVYDIQYLLAHGVVLRNFEWDTMLLHHALYSQLPKGLEFLGATYTNEVAWKSQRPKAQEEKKNA